MNHAEDITFEIKRISSKENLQFCDIEDLATYWAALQALGNNTRQESELTDIFPALSQYQNEHNIVNLQKLCVEVQEFCQSLYASTRNEDERKIYRAMVDKLRQ